MRHTRLILSVAMIALLSGFGVAQEQQRRAKILLKDRTELVGTITKITPTEIQIVEDSATSSAKLLIVKLSGISNIEFLEENPDSISSSGEPVNTAPAQMKCGTTPVHVPEVRGFRLGMSWDEYRRENGFDRTHHYADPDEIGKRYEYLSMVEFYFAQDKGKFTGLRSANLTFLDDALVKIEIHYDDTVKWPNDLEFTAAIAETLKLPTVGWKGHDPTVLTCNDFQVETEARQYLGSDLVITKIGLEQEIARRKQQYELKNRQTFKP